MQVGMILESCLFIYMYTQYYRMQEGIVLESCLFIYMYVYRMQVDIIVESCLIIYMYMYLIQDYIHVYVYNTSRHYLRFVLFLCLIGAGLSFQSSFV